MRSLRPSHHLPSHSRIPTSLNAKLDRTLAVCIAAAGSAGMGVLALAHPAEAEIVYTPTNTQVLLGSPVSLDIDHDGVTDIVINLRNG